MSHKVEILSVGTELLLGSIANTDAQMLSQGLSALGLNVYWHTVVGDNPQRAREAVAIAKQRADIIITTGGLGPTDDDLTKETVARVNKAAYLPLVEAIGIAHSVSPRLSAVNSILQYIRQGKVLSSVSVGGDAAEMLEALVDEESLVAGKRVHELGLPKGILLLGVIRGGEAFIPSGQTVIQPQDRIVLLSLREKMSKLEGIVSKKKE